MRTSHLAIKRMIAEQKSKLTDEQLFASPQYGAYLTDIVEGITKRYRRQSKVILDWDTSENAEIAHTDNRTIYINAGNHLTRTLPTRQLKAESLIGLLGHECGHILFSDFIMMETYHRTLKSGRFYPNKPKDISLLQTKYLDDILQAFEDKDEAVISAVSDITHSLVNIMEDVYIEGRMCVDYPGTVASGIHLINLKFAEEMDSVTEQIDKQHHEVFILINLLIQYAKTGSLNNLHDYNGPLLNPFYECLPYLDDAAYDDDSKVRYDAANKILLILWPYMKSFIEQLREDIKNGTSTARNDLATQVASGSSVPVNSGNTPVGGSRTKMEPGQFDDEMEKIQKVLDYESGRIALQKTDEIDDNGDGTFTRDNGFAGSGYVSQAAEDMERIATQIAEENAYIQYNEELTEELQKESNSIHYGNAHKNVNININRMSYVDESYMRAYQKIAPPLLLISKRLQKQISQTLKDYKEGGKIDNLPIGKRINVRNAFRNDGKLFYNRKLPNDIVDIAVGILVDESGSMSSKDRITHARSTAIILHDFCKGLDIPITIYGHTESSDVHLYAYAEFDSIDNKDQFRLMDMSSRSGNRDGAALRFVAERLMTRREELKLLFIISDGQPAGNGYYGTTAEADLRGIKKEYESKGIQLFAAAIGNDKENIQRIYKDSFLDITNLEKLPANLGKLIIQKIRHKYAA